jgi:hypothetical protein
MVRPATRGNLGVGPQWPPPQLLHPARALGGGEAVARSRPVASQKAYELAAGADVFGESYRTRKISNLGLSPEELAARRPGIVYASARCYAYDGPWDKRAGFDMEALCVTGFTTEDVTPERPAFPPTHVMNDYIAGYLGAAGIQAALIRRAKEGGSYHVRVALARCAMWFMSLGKFDNNAPSPTGDQHEILARKPLRLKRHTGNSSGSPHRSSSLKPSPFGKTPYWWCGGQARRNGRTADAPSE